jgi:hypothetical protein
MFRTLQDRVPKELRLAGITTIEAANVWLKAYIAEHNACFAVKPEQEGTMFVTDRDGASTPCAGHRRHKATDAMLYAFDLLQLDGKGSAVAAAVVDQRVIRAPSNRGGGPIQV